MSNKSTKATYERLIKGIMAQIVVLPKSEKEIFVKLKKKANKYLKKYESL